jgi:hypothetical protein
MAWHVELAYFLGGVFLGNFVPHFVNGVSGRKFPSPFGKPPGKGPSSPLSNVLWGLFNLLIAYLLIFKIGDFDIRQPAQAGMVGLGLSAIGVQLAVVFGRVKGTI